MGHYICFSLPCPPSFVVPLTEKAFILTPNEWKMFRKFNTELKMFSIVSFSQTKFNLGQYGLTNTEKSVTWSYYAEYNPVRSSSYKFCTHLTYEKFCERGKALSIAILDWMRTQTLHFC